MSEEGTMTEGAVAVEESQAPMRGNDSLVESAPEVTYDHEWQRDKFATVEDLSDSYGEMEKKFGGFTGAPEGGEYTFEFDAETYGDITLDTEDELYQKFTSMASGMGMSNDAAQEVMNMYVTQQGELYEAQQDSIPDYQEEVDSIDDFEARSSKLHDWGQSQFSEGEFEVFQDLVSTKEEFQVMERLMGMANSAPSVTGKRELEVRDNPNVDPAQKYRDMMNDPKFKVDPRFQKMVFEGLNRAYK